MISSKSLQMDSKFNLTDLKDCIWISYPENRKIKLMMPHPTDLKPVVHRIPGIKPVSDIPVIDFLLDNIIRTVIRFPVEKPCRAHEQQHIVAEPVRKIISVPRYCIDPAIINVHSSGDNKRLHFPGHHYSQIYDRQVRPVITDLRILVMTSFCRSMQRRSTICVQYERIRLYQH